MMMGFLLASIDDEKKLEKTGGGMVKGAVGSKL